MAAAAAGVERAHLQQARHAGVAAGGDQAAGEFDMRALEAGAAAAGLVEDADQVDRRVGAGQQRGQRGAVVDVGSDHVDAGRGGDVAVEVAVAAGNAHAPAGSNQGRGEMATDEAGAAEQHNKGFGHGEVDATEAGVGQWKGWRATRRSGCASRRWLSG